MKQTKRLTVNFDIGVNHYTADIEVSTRSEHDAGADADGNRGVYQEWIDEVNVIEVKDEDGIKVDTVTEEMKKEIDEVVNDIDMKQFPDYGPY